MSTILMFVVGWLCFSFFFALVVWPRWAEVAMPREERTVVKCKACGHVQRCCAPPCERCQSMNIQII